MTKPVLLALDAAESSCTVAIRDKDNNILTKKISGINAQAAVLLSSIQELLNDAQLKFSDLDALVLSNGPGRFTGLRVTHSCLQGIAYCYNKKIIPVNSLHLYAQQYIEQTAADLDLSFNKLLWVCLKAYGDNYYQAKFVVDNGMCYFHEINSMFTSKSIIESQLSEHTRDTNVVFIGHAWLDFLSASNIDSSQIYNESMDAKYILNIAQCKYEQGIIFSPEEIELVYGVNPYSKES